jgi:hypothetical protein
MEYQFTQSQQINQMDYWNLVRTLMSQITPQVRSVILSRLTEMNNQLLLNNSQTGIQSNPLTGIQSNPLTGIQSSSRKSDVTELPHPSQIYNPRSVPNYTPDVYTTTGLIPQSRPVSDPEINVDDLIDDLEIIPNVDPLDAKLAKIKALHSKILSDKRARRREREKKNQS